MSSSSTVKDMIKAIIDDEFNKRMEGIRSMVESMINEYLSSLGKIASSNHQLSKKKTAQRNSTKLNNFCQENYQYLLMPFLSTAIKSTNEMTAVLQKIVTNLYFHPDRKSNHIIYIPPHTYKVITVYTENSWRNFDLNTTLEKIVRRANDVLQHYMIGADTEDEEKFKKEIGNKKFELLKDFTNRIDNMDDDEDFMNKLLSDTERTIITNQHIIHKHIYDVPDDI